MLFRDHYTRLTPDQKRQLAERLGTSVPYLSQIAHGHRRAGPRLLLQIERATAGAVRAEDLRPDLYPPERESA